MLLVQLMDFIDGSPRRQQCCDNRSGTRAEDKVERFMGWLSQQSFYFAQDTKRVESFRTSAVQAQNFADVATHYS